MKYVTKMGEMWDEISKRELGSEKYVVELVRANREYINTFIFSAGAELELPEIDEAVMIELPPWRR